MENRLKNIEQRLKEQGEQLKEITIILKTIAVQNTRLDGVEKDITAIWAKIEKENTAFWAKWDNLVQPETGTLSVMKTHQASCPRGQIKFLWWFVVTVGVAIVGVAISVMRMSGNH